MLIYRTIALPSKISSPRVQYLVLIVLNYLHDLVHLTAVDQEASEESLVTSFQALEIMNNAYVEAPPVQPRLSGASLMVAQVILREVW